MRDERFGYASPGLKAIKALHTVAWAFFAGCIVAIPFASLLSAHHTENRRANFDIYLPEWLARYNKHIFGPLYFAVVVFAFARWASGA